MILQELYDLAIREQLVPDPDYEVKPVTWLITVNENGRLVSIKGTHFFVSEDGKKPKKIKKCFNVPRSGSRTSGDKAFFFCDKAEYVLGVNVPGEKKAIEPRKLLSRSNLFRDTVRKCAEETGDDGARAVALFLDGVSSGKEQVDLGSLSEKVAPNELFAFVYEPDLDCLVTDRDLIKKYWKKIRSPDNELTSGNDALQCLVTGEDFCETTLFPQIKKLPGGGASGVGLVSFNKNAFESYGWRGNQNAPISREAGEAVATALNRLIDNTPHDPNDPDRILPRQNIKLSADTIICYWNRGKGDFSAKLLGLLEPDAAQVDALYSGIWRGNKTAVTEDCSSFYAMTLSGTKGRAVIRDWFESTIKEVQENLCDYFNDLSIVRSNGKNIDDDKPIALSFILESLSAPSNNRSETVPGHLASGFVRAALSGCLFPATALHSAITRYRCEIGNANDPKEGRITRARNDSRAAVIKAVLNRKSRKYSSENIKYAEVLTYMDPNNKNPGYLLGCLMAVLEKMQTDAMQRKNIKEVQAADEEKDPNVGYQGVNATIVDRFFQGASATPKAVFPRLLQNSVHHSKKLRDKGAHGILKRYSNYIDEIISNFNVMKKENQLHTYSSGFPMFLNLDEQGLFVIGYHQMRHWLWMTNTERDQWEALHSDAPRAYKRNVQHEQEEEMK
jgi:CRISPR-associated protein Csd1